MLDYNNGFLVSVVVVCRYRAATESLFQSFSLALRAPQQAKRFVRPLSIVVSSVVVLRCSMLLLLSRCGSLRGGNHKIVWNFLSCLLGGACPPFFKNACLASSSSQDTRERERATSDRRDVVRDQQRESRPSREREREQSEESRESRAVG